MSTTQSATLAGYFVHDHRACDEAWARLEAAANGGGAEARAAWTAFEAAMEGNLGREERVLFPAFEACAGLQQGPTQVMKMEHQQMRAVLGQMATAAEAEDWELVLDHGDTLLMLVQQHNAKEEGVLFPMAERILGARWAELSERL